MKRPSSGHDGFNPPVDREDSRAGAAVEAASNSGRLFGRLRMKGETIRRMLVQLLPLSETCEHSFSPAQVALLRGARPHARERKKDDVRKQNFTDCIVPKETPNGSIHL